MTTRLLPTLAQTSFATTVPADEIGGVEVKWLVNDNWFEDASNLSPECWQTGVIVLVDIDQSAKGESTSSQR